MVAKLTEEQRWEKFWASVEKTETCWFWTGATDKDGYGQCSWRGRDRAHRFILAATGVDIKGKLVCHTCDNPSCVNPEHLYAGTCKSNMQDKLARERGRALFGEVHPLAKLTDAQCEELRVLADSGVHPRVLAAQFSCHITTARRIAARRGRCNGTGNKPAKGLYK